MKPILPRLIFVLLVFLVYSCQKDLSLDISGGNTPASFTLVNLETGCPSFTINGHYKRGAALTPGEFITVEVNVTKAGQWEFATDTVNGFSFSGNGSFSNTGKQAIVLSGTGIPLSPGNYHFSTTGASGDGFLIQVLQPGFTEEIVGATTYFKLSLDGQDFTINGIKQGPDDIPYGYGGADTAGFSSFVTGGNYPDIPEPGTISLSKDGMIHYYGSSDADFKNFFKPGSYPLRNMNPCNSFANGGTGFILAIVDANDNIWSTIEGSGEQEGSSMEIVGLEDGYNKAGNYFVKVKTRFNLKLYNYPTGEMRELTNGEMVSYFIKPL